MQAVDYNRFTDRARQVMLLANHVAYQLGRENVDGEQILFAMLSFRCGFGIEVLEALEVDLDRLRSEAIQPIELSNRVAVDHRELPLSPNADEAVAFAFRQAGKLKTIVGTDHLLLGLIQEESDPIAKRLSRYGIRLKAARNASAKLSRNSAERREPDELLVIGDVKRDPPPPLPYKERDDRPRCQWCGSREFVVSFTRTEEVTEKVMMRAGNQRWPGRVVIGTRTHTDYVCERCIRIKWFFAVASVLAFLAGAASLVYYLVT